MGIDIGSSLVVGAPKSDYNIEEIDYDGEYWYERYESWLSRVSPYYDAEDDDCIFGIEITSPDDFSYGELNCETLMDDINAAKKKLKEVFGIDAKLYVSPNVW